MSRYQPHLLEMVVCLNSLACLALGEYAQNTVSGRNDHSRRTPLWVTFSVPHNLPISSPQISNKFHHLSPILLIARWKYGRGGGGGEGRVSACMVFIHCSNSHTSVEESSGVLIMLQSRLTFSLKKFLFFFMGTVMVEASGDSALDVNLFIKDVVYNSSRLPTQHSTATGFDYCSESVCQKPTFLFWNWNSLN